MDMFKKVMFWITLVVIVLILFTDVTALQVIPFIGSAILIWLQIFNKNKLNVWIMVLSGLMALLNLTMLSYVDIIYWIMVFVAFFK
jgi:hypothetical protein